MSRNGRLGQQNALLLPTRIYTESTLQSAIDQVIETTNRVNNAFHGVLGHAVRIDELAQVGRFIPLDVLKPRLKQLSEELAAAEQGFKNVVADTNAPLQQGYLQYVSSAVSAINQGVMIVLADEDIDPLRNLFVEHPVNQWFKPIVDDKQMGRAQGMTDWRQWIQERYQQLSRPGRDKVKLSNKAVIDYLLRELGDWDTKAGEYVKKPNLDEQQKEAFDSLKKGRNNPNDYISRLKRDMKVST